jgi:ABC-2 type transport system ATP-binding protein
METELMSMQQAVVFENVVKAYGSFRALDGFNLKVNAGEVTALLGPNGAGKTTAVGLMLNMLRPSSGRIEIFGREPKNKELREMTGALLQETKPADGLRTGEILQLFRSYYKNPLSYERLLDLSGLHKEEKRKATALSGGQRRRLAFAQALAGNPSLIILDEPTVGMDVESRFRFWEVISALANDGKTILLTTHYLEEADAVSDQICVMAEGKLVASGTPQALKARVSSRTVSFRSSQELGLNILNGLPGVERAEKSGNAYSLYARETDELLRNIISSGWEIRDVQVSSGSLEAAFRQLTDIQDHHSENKEGA